MKCKLLLLSLVLALAATCFGQQISQDLHIVPPYNLCFGGYDGTAACFKKSSANTVDLTGTLTVNGSAVGGAGLTITTVSGLASVSGKTKGTIAVVTDGNSATDCTTGTGSTVVTCQYSGSTWAAFGGGSGDATTVNGAAVPSSKTLVGTNSSGQVVDASSSSISNNTSGTAANLSGTPALPNGTTATTQTTGDSTTKLATDAFVIANAVGGFGGRLSISAIGAGVKADGQYSFTATTTSSSATVTCSGCNFVAGDVGKIVWVMNGATLALSQTTILGRTDAHTITANTTASSGVTGTGLIVWGSDDTTALASAGTLATAVCGSVQLPAGLMLTQGPQFNTSDATCVANGSSHSFYNQPGVFGAGKQYTFLVPTPNFDFTNCSGAGIVSCFLGETLSLYKGFAIWGANYNPSGGAGKRLAANNGGFLSDMDFSGWCGTCAGSIGVYVTGTGPGNFWGGVETFGATTIYAAAPAAQFYNFVGFGSPVGLDVNAVNVISTGNYFQGSTAAVRVESGASWNSFSDMILTSTTGSANLVVWGRANLNSLQYQNVGAAVSAPISINGAGVVTSVNSTIPASTVTNSGDWLAIYDTGTFTDFGGNSLSGGILSPTSPSYVQAKAVTGTSSASTVTVTPTSNTTVSSVLLLGVEWVYTSGQSVTGCADTESNVYTQQGSTLLTSSSYGSQRAFAFFYTNGTKASASDAITCTFSTSVPYPTLNVAEFTAQYNPGGQAVSPFDHVYTNTGSGLSIAAGVTTSTTLLNDLTGFFGQYNGAGTYSNTGDAQTVVASGANSYYFSYGDSPSTPGTYSITGSMSANADWAGYWFAIRPATNQVAGPSSLRLENSPSKTGSIGVTTPAAGTFTTVTATTSVTTSGAGTIDATKLSGNLPAISGASLTGVNAATLGGATFAGPSMTPQSIDCHTACSPSAAQLSNAMVANYGQTTADVQITGPTPAAGMNFIMIVGTAQGANYWRYTSTTTNIYLDGAASPVTNIIFAAPAVGNSFSCFSFQTGASTYSLKCTTLAGTSTSS